jgi:hypothetical protein
MASFSPFVTKNQLVDVQPLMGRLILDDYCIYEAVRCYETDTKQKCLHHLAAHGNPLVPEEELDYFMNFWDNTGALERQSERTLKRALEQSPERSRDYSHVFSGQVTIRFGSFARDCSRLEKFHQECTAKSLIIGRLPSGAVGG